MSKHTPDQWVPIVALPPNPKVPDHYGHISECCGSVLMPPWEYERARHCIEACTGMADPPAEIAVLRDAVRVLGAEYQKIREHAWHGDFSNGVVSDSGVDEGDVRHVDYMDRSAKIVESNPIAAAAVKGTQ